MSHMPAGKRSACMRNGPSAFGRSGVRTHLRCTHVIRRRVRLQCLSRSMCYNVVQAVHFCHATLQPNEAFRQASAIWDCVANTVTCINMTFASH